MRSQTHLPHIETIPENSFHTQLNQTQPHHIHTKPNNKQNHIDNNKLTCPDRHPGCVWPVRIPYTFWSRGLFYSPLRVLPLFQSTSIVFSSSSSETRSSATTSSDRQSFQKCFENRTVFTCRYTLRSDFEWSLSGCSYGAFFWESPTVLNRCFIVVVKIEMLLEWCIFGKKICLMIDKYSIFWII